MSLGNDPGNTDPDEEAHFAVAAACEARSELLVDGKAPSKDRILRAMGRNPDGTPISPDPEPAHRAGQVARRIMRERMESWE